MEKMMNNRFLKYSMNTVPYFALAGAAFLMLFWTLFFTGAFFPGGNEDPVVSGFESAFPVADAVLALSLLGAGIGILRKKPIGTFSLIIAGSISLYLGILDVSFYCHTGVYFNLNISSLFCLFLNSVCIIGGLFALTLSWQLWRLK
jgi:hypothetical protein